MKLKEAKRPGRYIYHIFFHNLAILYISSRSIPAECILKSIMRVDVSDISVSIYRIGQVANEVAVYVKSHPDWTLAVTWSQTVILT